MPADVGAPAADGAVAAEPALAPAADSASPLPEASAYGPPSEAPTEAANTDRLSRPAEEIPPNLAPDDAAVARAASFAEESVSDAAAEPYPASPAQPAADLATELVREWDAAPLAGSEDEPTGEPPGPALEASAAASLPDADTVMGNWQESWRASEPEMPDPAVRAFDVAPESSHIESEREEQLQGPTPVPLSEDDFGLPTAGPVDMDHDVEAAVEPMGEEWELLPPPEPTAEPATPSREEMDDWTVELLPGAPSGAGGDLQNDVVAEQGFTEQQLEEPFAEVAEQEGAWVAEPTTAAWLRAEPSGRDDRAVSAEYPSPQGAEPSSAPAEPASPDWTPEALPATDEAAAASCGADAQSRDGAALVLERLAARIRRGELPVPEGLGAGDDALVLARLLAALLGASSTATATTATPPAPGPER